MKNKDFAALAKRLLPILPEFAVKGPMAAKLPLESVLRGIYFEGSSFDTNSFYVWVFLLPLFVPASNVSFNLGMRLRTPGGGDRWSTDMPNLIADLSAVVEREALPFLSGINAPKDLAEAAGKFQAVNDPYVQQAIAYAWARDGDIKRAVDQLDKLKNLLDIKVPWQRVMSDRAEELKAKLLDEPAKAKVQLETWEAETIKCLGLANLK